MVRNIDVCPNKLDEVQKSWKSSNLFGFIEKKYIDSFRGRSFYLVVRFDEMSPVHSHRAK
jgi:hypothetical protein